MMNQEKINIHDVLYKNQFRLKLGIKPLLLSRASFILFAFAYFLFDGINFLLTYSVSMLLYYKFFYSLTRDGYQYDVFGYLIFIMFIKKIREKRRKK
ncbi:hypothetical protein BKH41_08825 [Helicobacter sp. 12S02232-10]|nr:hypothetical protein BKH41_08825 [Helicobacter sp. 12S02232-10]